MQQTLPRILRDIATKYPEIPAQCFRNSDGQFISLSYRDLYSTVLDAGAGLLSSGVKRGDRIGIISDNRKEWQQIDMGILSIGAIDVPRGCDASPKDLEYILSFSESSVVVTENSTQVRKILNIKSKLPDLKKIIYFTALNQAEIEKAKECSVELIDFNDILSRGKVFRLNNPGLIEAEVDKGQKNDIAGIIFTSGTTGQPKGVMITHGNFITQLDELDERIYINPGERALCVLPVWHVFERLCEYVIMNQAGVICYSKPVGSILLADFQKLNPQLMPAVPRVFEAVYDGVNRTMRKTGGLVYALYKFFVAVAILHSRIDRKLFRKNARFRPDHLIFWWIVLVLPWLALYPLKLLGNALVFTKIRAKLGNSFRAGISGGGALPPAIDEFFWAVGIKVVEGYGLTETAPVVSVRPIAAPIFGTVGSPIRGVQARVVDQNGIVLGRARQGALQIKGGTVMKGYYRRDDLTEKVMTIDGWFDTGDIAMFTLNDEIVLKGRLKDTIVLRGGENVEPLPIEMKLNASRFVNASCVLGQDQRYLAALIVPQAEEIKNYAAENGIQYADYDDLLRNEEIQKLFEGEISGAINAKNGFKMFERINKFTLIKKEFEVGVELSAKQEMMRYRLNEIYKDKIAAMFE
jgi:long-chain acyl-CoA synthetase